MSTWILSKSGGYYQIMEPDPLDWDRLLSEIRDRLNNMPPEERFEAARQYMLKRYADAIR